MTEHVLSAARRECQVILGQMIWPIQHETLKPLLRQPGVDLIDISCGGGECTLNVSTMLHAESKVHVFETDPVNLERIRSRLNGEGIAVYEEAFEDSETEIVADVVYGSAVLNTHERNACIVRRALEALKPGGLLVLNFVDLSRIYGFPRSYAIDRFGEYLRKYQESLGQGLEPHHLKELCETRFFSHVSIETSVSHFLHGRQRELPSLLLEYLKKRVIDTSDITAAEVDAIIAELRHLSDTTTVMISAPAITQLTAVKRI